MALTPEVCVQTGSSGLDPSGGFRLPDVDTLDTASKSLRQHAEDYLVSFTNTTGAWRGLSAHYTADESATVLSAFDHLTPTAQRVQSTASSTAAALETFSGVCRDLKLRLEAYGRAVHALDADIDAFPTSVEKTTITQGGQQITTHEQRHWTGDSDLTAIRNRLSSDVEAIRSEYFAAQNTCAASLAEVSGGQVHRVDLPEESDLRSGSVVDEILYDAGSFFGIQHDEQRPWGNKTVVYRPHDVLGLMQGIGAGAVELVDGVWSFNPWTNEDKRDATYGGINAMAGAAGTLIASLWHLDDKEYQKREGQKIREAQDLFGSLPSAFIHLKDGETNVGWAIGGATFNIGSTVIGVGAGAAVKGGTLASKAGLAAEHLSIATMDSARLAAFSARLSATSSVLLKTGQFLDKPGSLALKVSDILAPNTTAKVQGALTKASVGSWNLVTKAQDGLVSGVKNTAANSLSGAAHGFRRMDEAFSRAVIPNPDGVLMRTGGHTAMADKLDSIAGSIKENNQPAFTPPRTSGSHAPASTFTSTMETKFPKPEHITDTVTLRHGDIEFPIHRKENFAARTNLKPSTEYIIENRRLMKDNTGEVNTATIEKYYTDETGKVTRVDTYAGVKRAWSPELMKPLPNVTYNVVAEVDGGLQNTFTLVMDQNAHLASAKGHIVSTLAGNSNRNGYQQLKAGRLGGPGYDGGHASPSALGFIGEKAGLFPHHEWQNRGKGTPNEIDENNNFHKAEMDVIDRVKSDLRTGDPVDLQWIMDLSPGKSAGLPSDVRLQYTFGDEDWQKFVFNNLARREGLQN
ncbi:hypothetical protein ACIPY3_11015 [Paenarthrobacter sp. NPDC089714]|uniref:hypothetical protein n=1 Tax=Paenarthrobacter sp. NPDC089714 TaxID=3364377 RepID=UPI0038131159